MAIREAWRGGREAVERVGVDGEAWEGKEGFDHDGMRCGA